MTSKELPKAYEPGKYENEIYDRWERGGFFKPASNKGKKSFIIMMPPPNVTGELHLGHASMLAFEDIMARFHRMLGEDALWLPGTDHAGIATQNKVERLLLKEGLTRQDLGRDKFIERVWQYVNESRGTIKNQIRKMGASCDWSRERFTLDEGFSNAVKEMFVRMYEDGLIYRGHRIVNWCPRCQSTLADDEVKYVTAKGKFYYFKYGPFVIGTARPETKYLDSVVVVHPDDERYKKYVGKDLAVEWIGGKIKAQVIADPVSDPEKGTGAMTITPGHSFTDFELAEKYKLPVIKMIDELGKMTAANRAYAGLTVKEAREKFVEVLEQKGLLHSIDENYEHNLSVCYRCDTPIEPLPSDQWFVAVDRPVKSLGGESLKERALKVVRDGEIKIIPERFEKVYMDWLTNLHDWCISRQLWWGHRIPVWYDEHGKPVVARNEAEARAKAKTNKLTQDEDTLDTWFSSGLWTFGTLGWPEKTAELKAWHPTAVLETGYDILFFWVARMILMTEYALGEIPFETVYLHGLVRDKDGRKMSKSLGNGIDPLAVSEKYGTDAVRLSLVLGAAAGSDIRLYDEKIEGYRNLVNKLWNISRYILGSVTAVKRVEKARSSTLADRWILHRLNEVIDEVTDQLARFDFSNAGQVLQDFSWSELADWYLEISKVPVPHSLGGGVVGEGEKDEILLYILERLLKLWHPFAPFVTEVLWRELGTGTMLIGESWPERDKSLLDKKAVKEFGAVKEMVVNLRNLRADYRVPVKEKLAVVAAAGGLKKLLAGEAEVIKKLAGLKEFDVVAKAERPSGSLVVLSGDIKLYVSLGETVDTAKETIRLSKESQALEKYLKSVKKKLQNKEFLVKAPAEVVAAEKAKLNVAEKRYAQLKTLLAG